MDTKTCPKCEAKWIGGNHYWSTGAKGNEADLAGLVCDKLGTDQCINPLKGAVHTGDSWEKRSQELELTMDRLDIDGTFS